MSSSEASPRRLPTNSSDRSLASLRTLRRSLSTESVPSTASSFATRMQISSRSEHRDPLRVIGLGSCGTVLELPGTDRAMKKSSDPKALWNDFTLTNTVHNSVSSLLSSAFPTFSLPKTPACHEFHLASHSHFWTPSLQKRLPYPHHTLQPCFIVDRILPLPQPTQEALITQFFEPDPEMQEEALDDVDDKDCHARIYLGERESIAQQQGGGGGYYESLRNFPLRLNMTEDIGLNIAHLAGEMAVGLAVLHWRARVDAMDVEFVLGSSASKGLFSTSSFPPPSFPSSYPSGSGQLCTDIDSEPRNVEPIDFTHRQTHLWMFDLDKAAPFRFVVEDVKTRLVHACRGNDPYYPRPSRDEEDGRLWEVFKGAYLKASELILREAGNCEVETMALPGIFVAESERLGMKDERWDPEEQIQFG